MIFVTVGTDGPFDRLIRAVDLWAAQAGRTDVFAQIGKSTLKPRFIQYAEFLEPPEFQDRFMAARLVISHAGMGTILTALRYGKPLLVMPRRAGLGEQRNDHQLATARRLSAMGKIVVAFDEPELMAMLGTVDELAARESTGPYAQPALLAAIHDYIHSEDPAYERASGASAATRSSLRGRS